jgi:hypothetical protein
MVPVVNWTKDKRGSTTVQSLLFIAIFVVILYMSFQIWMVVSIKQSLQAATYQAAKYIALNGLHWGLSGGAWAEQVWPFIVTELQNNPFLPGDSIRAGPPRPNPAITIWLNPECNRVNYCEEGQFSIKVELEYAVFIPPRFGEASSTLLPLKFTRTVRGRLQCYP